MSHTHYFKQEGAGSPLANLRNSHPNFVSLTQESFDKTKHAFATALQASALPAESKSAILKEFDYKIGASDPKLADEQHPVVSMASFQGTLRQTHDFLDSYAKGGMFDAPAQTAEARPEILATISKVMTSSWNALIESSRAPQQR